MMRHILLVAAALSFLSSTNACRCLPPPPLSECEVDKGEAALLVTMKCVKTVICDINSGVAVADVVIDAIFQDNTGRGLKRGDMVTISSSTQSSLCGVGLSFQPGTQWIMFAKPPFRIDGVTADGRRLRQTEAAAVFSDGSICDVESSDLSTNGCAGNIIDPTEVEIEELLSGCST